MMVHPYAAKQAQRPTASLSEHRIVDLPAWALSQHIHSLTLSCEAVMTAYLTQIERVNPKVNAIVALQAADDLLQQARDKDQALTQGKDHGWLHGFPQAIKDLEATKGIATTLGSLAYQHHIPQTDSLQVRRIKQAGAIIIGKTNTPEFGYGSHTYNAVYGTTANPYDAARSAGGSSGGAAAALAMRMQAVVDGSDYMGSLRNPAGWCNVFGFRPSAGRVPVDAPELFMNQLATLGPMARTVPDLALMLKTQSGYDGALPSSLPLDPDLQALNCWNVHAYLDSQQQGRRVAWLGDWDGYLAMAPDVLPVCQNALTTLADMGLSVTPISPPMAGATLWHDCWLPHRHFSATRLKALYDDPQQRRLLKPEAIFEYEGSLPYTASALYAASLVRSKWYACVQSLLASFDYLAVPTAQLFPFDKRQHWPRHIAGRAMNSYHRWMEVTVAWSLSGHPTVALPAGFNQQGLPMGIQVVGRARQDFKLLQLAYAYEQACDPVNHRPPPDA